MLQTPLLTLPVGTRISIVHEVRDEGKTENEQGNEENRGLTSTWRPSLPTNVVYVMSIECFQEPLRAHIRDAHVRRLPPQTSCSLMVS
ncbi:Hypothetical protein FKW44_020883 [Caligus rogercresseyi]|uniref:Uncharacterized protein n=1 Tax=Caligus rogercresseyi TaxID=217165 RepID=A0A7T8JUW9_CALRO|nr:Hypothetical protein FKW44_020883 [Caligus rogercresseyi]